MINDLTSFIQDFNVFHIFCALDSS